MNIKTITTIDGVNEVDFGSSASRFYWFQNLGTTTVHVSGKADIVAGSDGVAELAAGDSVCIETLGGKVYVLGAGKVQIHNTGDKFCPFKIAPVAGGGEAVDAYTKSESDAKYAQKTDIPTTLPANGGNADTVGGKTADEFMPYIGYVDDLGAVNQNCICSWNINTLNTPFKAGKTNAAAGICIVNSVNGLWPTYFVICSGVKQCFIHYKNPNNGEFVGNWKEISTTPIKSTTVSGTTDANGNLMLWAASENKIPICAILTGFCSSVFYYAPHGAYYVGVSDINTQAYSPNVSVSGTVYYI